MTSAVLILPAALRNAGNALSESMGWGPAYSVALSPSGAEPATHYGCRPEVTQGFFDLLAAPPPEAAPILAALISDFRETCDPFGHWTEVIAANGLMVVVPPE